jgi:adenosylcobinamide-GDP ribazoletransferase
MGHLVVGHGLLVAITFLTRVPVRARVDGPADLARSVPWFPVVGALVGGVLGFVYAFGLELWPSPIAAAVALVAGLFLTGAFHEDGLADSADALGGGLDREQALRILRDPTHGSYGVLAIVTSFALRLLALATLGASAGVATLIAAHSLSRAAAVVALGSFPAAADEGLGAAYARSTGRVQVALGGIVGLVIGIGALGVVGGLATVAIVPGSAIVIRLALRKIGGLTGDVLGAIQQVAEISILLLAAGVAYSGGTVTPWA